MKELTEEHKKNLLLLADGLEGIPQEFFDMGWYRSEGEITKNLTDCGTVGCALGWGPFIKGIAPKEEHYGNYVGLYFERYTKMFMSSTYSPAWQWCFASRWRHTDNTATGAALRIRELVNNGLPITWWDQMNDSKIYMFAEALEL